MIDDRITRNFKEEPIFCLLVSAVLKAGNIKFHVFLDIDYLNMGHQKGHSTDVVHNFPSDVNPLLGYLKLVEKYNAQKKILKKVFPSMMFDHFNYQKKTR